MFVFEGTIANYIYRSEIIELERRAAAKHRFRDLKSRERKAWEALWGRLRAFFRRPLVNVAASQKADYRFG